MSEKWPHYAEIHPSRVRVVDYRKQGKDSPYQNVAYHPLPSASNKNNEREPWQLSNGVWWIVSAIIGWLAVIGAYQVLVWARPVWVWIDK